MLQIRFDLFGARLSFDGPLEIGRPVEALLERFPTTTRNEIGPELNARVARRGRSFAVDLEAEGRRRQFELETPVQVFGLIYSWLFDRLAPADSESLGLHAAAVGSPTRMVVLPASANLGKSTLALGLAARGTDVFCDELTLLDRRSGEMRPVPVAIGCRADTFRLLEEQLPPPAAEIGGVRLFRVAEPGSSCRLTAIVVVEASGGVGDEPRLGRLTCTEGVIELLRQLRAPDALAGLCRSEERGFGGLVTQLALTLRDVRFYRLSRGRLDSMIDAVESVLTDE